MSGAPPTQTAKVQVLAVHGQAGSDGTSNLEQRILDRIKKCLQRAQHPNTPESEAQAAWRMASRLMAQYNVTQADLLDQTTNDHDYAALGGESVVDITSTKGGLARANSQTWVHHVATAMTIFFDCQSYSTRRRSSVEWTFYGIAANTVAAAIAFEMAHNLTLEWARSKTGRSAKHSYCLGVGIGLGKIARREKREEKKLSERTETRGEQSQQENHIPHHTEDFHHDQKEISHPLLKARVSPCLENDEEPAVKLDDDSFNAVKEEGNSTDDSDLEDQAIFKDKDKTPGSNRGEGGDENPAGSEDQGGVSDEDEVEAEVTFKEEEEEPLDLDADLEDQLHRMAPGVAPAASTTVVDRDSEGQLTVNPWNTSQALVRFRQSAEKVATEYLKANNTKLRKGRRRDYMVRNEDAYRDGIEDSKQIDVKRRRIEGA